MGSAATKCNTRTNPSHDKTSDIYLKAQALAKIEIKRAYGVSASCLAAQGEEDILEQVTNAVMDKIQPLQKANSNAIISLGEDSEGECGKCGISPSPPIR